MEGFGKPIIITEVGVSGGDAYRRLWLGSLRARDERFPRLEAVIYFNAVEPYHWPESHGSPDWRISPRDLD